VIQSIQPHLRAHVVRIDRERALELGLSAGDVAGLRERHAECSRDVGGLREERLGLLQRGQRVLGLLVVAKRPRDAQQRLFAEVVEAGLGVLRLEVGVLVERRVHSLAGGRRRQLHRERLGRFLLAAVTRLAHYRRRLLAFAELGEVIAVDGAHHLHHHARLLLVLLVVAREVKRRRPGRAGGGRLDVTEIAAYAKGCREAEHDLDHFGPRHVFREHLQVLRGLRGSHLRGRRRRRRQDQDEGRGQPYGAADQR